MRPYSIASRTAPSGAGGLGRLVEPMSERKKGPPLTNDDSVLREVDRAVAEDRQWANLRQNGPILVIGALAIVLVVGGWQVWSAQKSARAGEAAVEFAAASDALGANPEDGRAALESVAAEAPGGYAALAEMRLAGSLAAGGDRDAALAAYRKIYNDGASPKRLRELARLRAAQLSLTDNREAVLSDLGSLTESKTAFGPYARELAAIAAFQAKDYETASEMFTTAAADPETPAPIRQRAEELAALAASGKAGVNLTGEAKVDDLMKALEEPASVSHEGHDHGAAPDAAETPPATDDEAETAPDAAADSDQAEGTQAEDSTEPQPDGDGETQDQ